MGNQSDGSGAQGNSPANDDNAPLHSLVSKIVGDPANPPKTLVVRGYLGSAGSGRDDYRRIYLDNDFRTYFEVAKTDILHAQKADPDHEDEPTSIVVNGTAKLALVQAVEAWFCTARSPPLTHWAPR